MSSCFPNRTAGNLISKFFNFCVSLNVFVSHPQDCKNRAAQTQAGLSQEYSASLNIQLRGAELQKAAKPDELTSVPEQGDCLVPTSCCSLPGHRPEERSPCQKANGLGLWVQGRVGQKPSGARGASYIGIVSSRDPPSFQEGVSYET